MFLETENICSHCYHEEKLHNIDLSKMDINPNKLDSNGRACIGCNEDHLTVLCHEFLSRLTGEKDDGHRKEELINHKQSANNTGYTNEKNIEKYENTNNKANRNGETMKLSKIDECLLLNHEIRDASNYIKNQFGDDAVDELHGMVFANTTEEEWNAFQKVNQTINDLFLRRRYDVWNFMILAEEVKSMYPDGPPPIVNIDHSIMPPETLQLGLYLVWEWTSVVRAEDEDDEHFERRKDWHDFLNGYVNQEAIQRPLIDISEIFDELAKKREIIKNYMGIIVRNRNR